MDDAANKMLHGLLDREKFNKLSHDQLYDIFVLLLRRNDELTRRVESLEKRLNQNSGNSSKPPSTDQPGSRKSSHEPTGKNPGGQPGHKANFRTPIAKDRVDEFIAVIPDHCGHCKKPLRGKDSEPRTDQKIELPPMRARVTEYELHALTCRHCGKTTRGKLPEGVSKGLLGPHLLATIGQLTGGYHLSKRQVQALLLDFFGLDLCLGSITKSEKAVSQALQSPVEEARTFVEKQVVGNADETGWVEGRKLAWLWVLSTKSVSVFKVHAHRGKEGMKAALGSFYGILGTDRWQTYNDYCGYRQICWAHLIRDFEEFRQSRGRPGAVGKKMHGLAQQLFKSWHKVQAGKLSRKAFAQRIVPPMRRKLMRLLHRGLKYPAMRGACHRILKLEPFLWTFVEISGVEPTNNAAERALRPAVLWRKGSFGTHSPQGSRFAERMLTVTTTLRQQKRNVLDFLTKACAAKLGRSTTPSLLSV
jgi:transposase